MQETLALDDCVRSFFEAEQLTQGNEYMPRPLPFAPAFCGRYLQFMLLVVQRRAVQFVH